MRVAVKFCLVCCGIGALTAAAPAFGAVTVTAVGPGTAQPGDTVRFEFYISADPGILLRAYTVSPPCALVPQEGATGTVDQPVIDLDTGHVDPAWVMCGAPCNCICGGFPLLDPGACDVAGDAPRVGWAAVFGVDSAAVGVGPTYLAHADYLVSGDAEFGFDFAFVDPEPGGTASQLRDENSDPIIADWIGTKLEIVLGVPCTDCIACDDNDACTKDGLCEGGGICELSCQILFGDATDNGVVNIQDVLTCNGAVGPGGLCAFPACDVAPICTGNGVLNIQDVLTINGTVGQPDPCSCPPRDCP